MSGNKTRARATKKNESKILEKELRLIMAQQKRNAQPPRWLANPPQHRIVRFGVVANQAEFDVTMQTLFFCQCMAAGATQVYTLAYAVRLEAIRIWFTSPTAGTSISATIEWNAAATGFLLNGGAWSETNSSTTELVCLESRPPKSSLSSWYQGGPNAQSNVICSLSAPAGAILEFEYDWVMNNTEAAVSSPLTVSGATAGIVYCRGINTNILALPPLNSAI